MTDVAAVILSLGTYEDTCKNGPALWVEDAPTFQCWSVFLAINVCEGRLPDSYPHRYIDIGGDDQIDARTLAAV